MEPLFIDITWGAGGSTSDATLDIATTAQMYHGVDIMMHLTCSRMTKEDIRTALLRAQEGGIRNILALRGDPVKGEEEWELMDETLVHAIDLVRLIREEHGDYFGIAVAGHPGSIVHKIYLFVFCCETFSSLPPFHHILSLSQRAIRIANPTRR